MSGTQYDIDPGILSEFSAALREECEQQIAASPPRPHLEAMLLAFPSGQRALGATESGDIPIETPAQRSESIAHLPDLSIHDPELFAFARDLQQSTQAQLQSRTLQPTLSPAKKGGRRRSWISGATVLAVAAVAVLWVLNPGDMVFRLSGGSVHERYAAARQLESEELERQAATQRKRHRRATPPATHDPRSPSDTTATKALGVESETETTETQAVTEAVTETSHLDAPPQDKLGPGEIDPPKRPRTASTNYQALQQKASRAWSDGQLKKAQSLLRKIAYRCPDRRLAESAFADLFSIGRQLGGKKALHHEWRRYLRRYPHGRYAQDARAGQCQTSKPDGAVRCWKQYLRDFPQGVYRQQAQDHLDGL